MNQEINSRFMRQLGIYNPNEHEDDRVTMIGCGGIGSFTAAGLAKLGIPHLTLIDPDEVEEHNLPNQNYSSGDIACPKVEALAGLCHDEYNTIEAYQFALPNPEVPTLTGLVMSGLDSMSARKEIWDECIKYNPRVPLYVDARLSGEYMLAYAVNPTSPGDIDSYELTLHSDDEGEEVSCTERGIIDVGLQVASMLTRIARRHFNRQEVPNITIMNQASYVTTQGGWVK